MQRACEGASLAVLKHRRVKHVLWTEVCYKLLEELTQEDHETVIHSYVSSIRACAKTKDLYRGTLLHHHLLKSGLLHLCSNALVTMYARCGALVQAQNLLDLHKSRDAFSWTSIIAGYAQNGQAQDALDCFDKMQREGLCPDAVTFACILRACGSLKAADKGEQVHDEIARQGWLGNDIVLGNALIDMYVKCGVLAKAHQVLEELPIRDIVSWNALIAGYAHQGQGEQALDCFELMQREGLLPNAVTFVCVLKACGSVRAIEKGEQIHDRIDEQRLLENNIVLGNALADMYIKCGALTKAQQVLDKLPFRNVVSWSALIVGYAQQGQVEKALNCFERMQFEGVSPDVGTLSCVLKACGSVGAVDSGEQVHDEIARHGWLGDSTVLGNALVDMYAKCGALAKAQSVLEELCIRNIASWNALVRGYVQKGQVEQAFECCKKMQCDGLSPDKVTYLHILKACGSIGAARKGEQIHHEIVRKGFLKNNVVLGTALLDMYSRCGAFAPSQEVCEGLSDRDVIFWSALLGASQKWGNVKVGRWAFELAVQVDERDAVPYVLMANLHHAACGVPVNTKL